MSRYMYLKRRYRNFWMDEYANKLIRHLGFRYWFWPKYKVTWTWIGRIDMSCAHVQWVANGHCQFMKFSLHDSTYQFWPDPVRLPTRYVESAYGTTVPDATAEI